MSQWLQKYVIAKSGETRGSRTALLKYNWNFDQLLLPYKFYGRDM